MSVAEVERWLAPNLGYERASAKVDSSSFTLAEPVPHVGY